MRGLGRMDAGQADRRAGGSAARTSVAEIRGAHPFIVRCDKGFHLNQRCLKRVARLVARPGKR